MNSRFTTLFRTPVYKGVLTKKADEDKSDEVFYVKHPTSGIIHRIAVDNRGRATATVPGFKREPQQLSEAQLDSARRREPVGKGVDVDKHNLKRARDIRERQQAQVSDRRNAIPSAGAIIKGNDGNLYETTHDGGLIQVHMDAEGNKITGSKVLGGQAANRVRRGSVTIESPEGIPSASDGRNYSNEFYKARRQALKSRKDTADRINERRGQIGQTRDDAINRMLSNRGGQYQPQLDNIRHNTRRNILRQWDPREEVRPTEGNIRDSIKASQRGYLENIFDSPSRKAPMRATNTNLYTPHNFRQ